MSGSPSPPGLPGVGLEVVESNGCGSALITPAIHGGIYIAQRAVRACCGMPTRVREVKPCNASYIFPSILPKGTTLFHVTDRLSLVPRTSAGSCILVVVITALLLAVTPLSAVHAADAGTRAVAGSPVVSGTPDMGASAINIGPYKNDYSGLRVCGWYHSNNRSQRNDPEWIGTGLAVVYAKGATPPARKSSLT